MFNSSDKTLNVDIPNRMLRRRVCTRSNLICRTTVHQRRRQGEALQQRKLSVKNKRAECCFCSTISAWKGEDWHSLLLLLLPRSISDGQFWQLHVDIKTVDHRQEKMIERQLIDLSCSRAGTRNCRVPWNFSFLLIVVVVFRQAHRPHQFKSMRTTTTNSLEIANGLEQDDSNEGEKNARPSPAALESNMNS